MTVTRPDEYGVEETVTELVPGKLLLLIVCCACVVSNIKHVSTENDNHTHNSNSLFCYNSLTAPLAMYAKESVFVPPVLAKWLRPHQREGVQFVYECVMGLKDFDGAGCILADDMGLGKVGLICRKEYLLINAPSLPQYIS